MTEAIRASKQDSVIEAAQKEVTEFMRKKRAAWVAREEARKAWWKEYYEQLAKQPPNQGGAKHSKHKNVRAWKLM